MNVNELKKKALALPAEPGVYLMKDKDDRVIYVGKAKKLKNRVSQYFQNTSSHSVKTRQMVSKVDHFDVFVAASEFEALVLECAQIKQHMPRYNILLKDDKGYPYIRVDTRLEYPTVTMCTHVAADGAEYYGPFGSRGVTNEILKNIKSILKLPECSVKLPKDIGKHRACLRYHMGQCEGWCQKEGAQEQYRNAVEQARLLLSGNYKRVVGQLRDKMLEASDSLNFELAANMRDRIASVELLSRKQLVTAVNGIDTDVIGFYANETKACFAVLHFSDGSLVDKDYSIVALPDDQSDAVASLIKQYYMNRGFAPKQILLPLSIGDEELLEELFYRQFNKKTKIVIPQRGNNVKLVLLAQKNAREEVERVTLQEEKKLAALKMLGNMLSIEMPIRIESYDISNISGTDVVASMVVFINGKPRRSEYKQFKINEISFPDDYGSMRQVVLRRFQHLLQGDADFSEKPDLVLIDGGENHARIAHEALDGLGVNLNVFGMVKDDRHRTRALVSPDGEEIGISTNQSVFSLIGNIQEETHRFAINFHRKLRSKRLHYSELDKIPGIGSKRKETLLKTFKSLAAIKKADIESLRRCLPHDAASAVYNFYHPNNERG